VDGRRNLQGLPAAHRASSGDTFPALGKRLMPQLDRRWERCFIGANAGGCHCVIE
jgi:hypothetical protein